MCLVESIYCALLPFYLKESNPEHALILIGITCGILCFMTSIVGQLTMLMLDLKQTWFEKYQKFNIFMTVFFTSIACIDILTGSHLAFEEVIFSSNSIKQKIVVFTPLGYVYLSFLLFSYILFTTLYFAKKSILNLRLEPVFAGFFIYCLCMISDICMLFELYDYYWLQHFGYSGVALSFTWVFVSEHFDTDRKYHEALRSLSQQKESLLKAKNEKSLGLISAYIGHEIKIPLSVIILNIFLLRNRMQQEEKTEAAFEKYAIRVERATRIILKIIESIFSFVQHNIDRNHQLSSVKEICYNAKLFTEEKIKQNHINLSFILPESDFSVYCNSTQITQVIINLISNSCDAVCSLKDKWVKVYIHRLDDCCKIQVMDSGKGIPEELISKISEPYFTSKKNKQGSGLGLSIVSEIAQLHNASLKFGIQNGNTCITFLLPS